MSYDKRKQIPKDLDGPLRVLCIGRVSTTKQDIGNIEAGYEYAKRGLEGITDSEIYIKYLGEQGSGMLTDRATILEACSELATGTWDVLIMEDSSKSYRNPRWMLAFIQDAVDMGTRVIAPGDQLDTWEENWELLLNAAALRHGMHIPDTRRRVRRTATKSFHDGGMVLRIRAGYRKLSKEEAASGQHGPKGLRLTKIPQCTPVITQLKDKIVQERQYGRKVADWLNEHGKEFPPGPYAKQLQWTWPLLLNFLRDPILYGLRRFRNELYQPIFRTGKHRRDHNPNPESESCPSLVHMSEAQWLELQKALVELAPDPSCPVGRQHPRHHVPRRKSLVPLQHAVCAACGDFLYLAGNGVIKCQNALSHASGTCWNHVLVSSQIVREKIVDLLLKYVSRDRQGYQAMLDAAWQQMERSRGTSAQLADQLEKQILDLRIRGLRLAEAIELGGTLESLVKQASLVEKDRKRKEAELESLRKQGSVQTGPTSRQQMEIDPRAALLELAGTSFEFADLVRKIIPRFIIGPVQALDSGLVRPRARLTINLGALRSGSEPEQVTNGAPPEELTLDLFGPPAHIAAIPLVIAAKERMLQAGQKITLDALAEASQINRMTVKRALDYQKLMAASGLTEPYRVLHEAPEKASRWKPRAQGS